MELVSWSHCSPWHVHGGTQQAAVVLQVQTPLSPRPTKALFPSLPCDGVGLLSHACSRTNSSCTARQAQVASWLTLRWRLQRSGTVTYNGKTFDQFVPERTSAYVTQYDEHMAELTVRETLDFSRRVQGAGNRQGKAAAHRLLVEFGFM